MPEEIMMGACWHCRRAALPVKANGLCHGCCKLDFDTMRVPVRGEQVRTAYESRGLTLANIEARTGLNYRYLTAIENDFALVRGDTVRRLMDVLDYPLGWFVWTRPLVDFDVSFSSLALHCHVPRLRRGQRTAAPQWRRCVDNLACRISGPESRWPNDEDIALDAASWQAVYSEYTTMYGTRRHVYPLKALRASLETAGRSPDAVTMWDVEWAHACIGWRIRRRRLLASGRG